MENDRWRRGQIEMACRGVFEFGDPMPSDPLEELKLRAMRAFHVAEEKDLADGSWRHKDGYIVLEVVPRRATRQKRRVTGATPRKTRRRQR